MSGPRQQAGARRDAARAAGTEEGLIAQEPDRPGHRLGAQPVAGANRHLDDGRLAIDNNLVERQTRGVAVGRKNGLFAGSDEGAKRAAVHYSTISTCSLLGVEPWAYLTDLLKRLANGEDPATLTPRSWKAQRPAVTVA